MTRKRKGKAKVTLQVDGAITVNPGGKATFGYVILDEHNNLFGKGNGILGEGPEQTNNTADKQFRVSLQCL